MKSPKIPENQKKKIFRKKARLGNPKSSRIILTRPPRYALVIYRKTKKQNKMELKYIKTCFTIQQMRGYNYFKCARAPASPQLFSFFFASPSHPILKSRLILLVHFYLPRLNFLLLPLPVCTC